MTHRLSLWRWRKRRCRWWWCYLKASYAFVIMEEAEVVFTYFRREYEKISIVVLSLFIFHAFFKIERNGIIGMPSYHINISIFFLLYITLLLAYKDYLFISLQGVPVGLGISWCNADIKTYFLLPNIVKNLLCPPGSCC